MYKSTQGVINSAVILALYFIVFMVVCVYSIFNHFLKSPFSYPYFIYDFDVSRKRNPQIDDLLDMFLISGGLEDIKKHQKRIEYWKEESCQQIENSLMKKRRNEQYLRTLDDNNAFVFRFIRLRTRNGVESYVLTDSFSFNYEYIQQRYNDLSDIDFECTLREYHSKNQRKLATRELREKIMIRDNYTCQLCGKYMPDEVGLQIDHIVPISKGGKTVESNLRVLCSKCNSSKRDKMPF